MAFRKVSRRGFLGSNPLRFIGKKIPNPAKNFVKTTKRKYMATPLMLLLTVASFPV